MYFDTSILFTAHHTVSAASSPGRRLVRAIWLCRGLGQAWRWSTAKGVEKSKLKIKNGSSKNWSSKGKIYKDPCLSHNENHGLKTVYASLHLKWLWRQPSASDQRHITWHHRDTSLRVTCVVSNCFHSSIVTFLACKVTYKIVLFVCKLYIKYVGDQNLRTGDQNFSVSRQLAPERKS